MTKNNRTYSSEEIGERTAFATFVGKEGPFLLVFNRQEPNGFNENFFSSNCGEKGFFIFSFVKNIFDFDRHKDAGCATGFHEPRVQLQLHVSFVKLALHF